MTGMHLLCTTNNTTVITPNNRNRSGEENENKTARTRLANL